MHKILDFFEFPRSSFLTKELGWFGRLTFDWLWTDNPELDELEQELRKKEGRY